MANAQRSDVGGFPFAFDMADRLDKAMRVAGLTREDMAEALDVSVGTVGNYRSGRTEPSKLQIKEWAVRTGAPFEWLLTGHEPSDPTNRRISVPKVAGSIPVGGTIIQFPSRTPVAVDRGTVAPVTSITGERVA